MARSKQFERKQPKQKPTTHELKQQQHQQQLEQQKQQPAQDASHSFMPLTTGEKRRRPEQSDNGEGEAEGNSSNGNKKQASSISAISEDAQKAWSLIKTICDDKQGYQNGFEVTRATEPHHFAALSPMITAAVGEYDFSCQQTPIQNPTRLRKAYQKLDPSNPRIALVIYSNEEVCGAVTIRLGLKTSYRHHQGERVLVVPLLYMVPELRHQGYEETVLHLLMTMALHLDATRLVLGQRLKEDGEMIEVWKKRGAAVVRREKKQGLEVSLSREAMKVLHSQYTR